jgi:hypothetical protein
MDVQAEVLRLGDADPAARLEAREALAAAAPEVLLEALCAALTGDAPVSLALALVQQAERLDLPWERLEPLLAVALAHREPHVRWQAVALADRYGEPARPLLHAVIGKSYGNAIDAMWAVQQDRPTQGAP